MSRKNSAGSSITDLIGVMPEVCLDGGTPRVWSFPELGAETFKAGERVVLSGSAGNAVGITAVWGSSIGGSGLGILGFAADDALGVASTFRGVYVATPEIVFVGNIGHSLTSALAQTAATDLGQLYGLTSCSGRSFVDKAKVLTSNVAVRVLGLHGQDDCPSFYGRVYFQVLQDKCQLTNRISIDISTPAGLIV